MTWFNKDKRIIWLKVNNDTDFNTFADQIIEKYLNQN
jgi:hypothetical protein